MSHTAITYLLHFERPIGNTDSKTGYAQHYTGSAADLPRRLARHQAGSDAKIMRAVKQAGIGWVLARTWPGGRDRERQIKAQGGASRHCPVCKGQAPAVEAVSQRVPQPQRPAPAVRATEPEALEDSLSVRVTAAEARALDSLLADAEATAWSAGWGTPGWSRINAMACDLSGVRNAEASAVERLAEERAIAEADGWGREMPRPDRGRELEAG
jgi:hypothetical protein